MSHFYGTISESARKNAPTACGHKTTGLTVEAACWSGKVVTRLWHNELTGYDHYEVTQDRHHGSGLDRVVLSHGIIGQAYV